MQPNLLAALNGSRNKVVLFFTMIFSKNFDNVRHRYLAEKLKSHALSPYVVNWYLSFLSDRKQRVFNIEWNGL